MKPKNSTPVITKTPKVDIYTQKKQELKECLARIKEMNNSNKLTVCKI